MKIRLIRSAVIEAPIERVWAVLRDFNSHERWHPAVTRSQMENDFDGGRGRRRAAVQPH
jgi:uncharacterized protein YndB with AHSA1/START domain